MSWRAANRTCRTGDRSSWLRPGCARRCRRRPYPAITVRPFAFRNGDFVVVISAVPGGRAGNTPGTARYIAIGTDKGDTFPVKAVPGRNAFALDFAAARADIEATIARTLTHELGHSMGLGDEYIEFDEPFSEVGSRPFANLQIEKDAQVPDPADPTKRVLDGDEIQWKWHRITAAAVVNGDIAADPGGLDRFGFQSRRTCRSALRSATRCASACGRGART